MGTVGLTRQCEGIMAHRTTVVVWGRIHVRREAAGARGGLQGWSELPTVLLPRRHAARPQASNPQPHCVHPLLQKAQRLPAFSGQIPHSACEHKAYEHFPVSMSKCVRRNSPSHRLFLSRIHVPENLLYTIFLVTKDEKTLRSPVLCPLKLLQALFSDHDSMPLH